MFTPLLPTNPKFYETVDEKILEAIKYLNSIGIPTTPSCSGHFSDLKDYDLVYGTLEKDQKKITSHGLILKDPYCNEEYLFNLNTYQVPWSKSVFMEKSKSYQNKGVVGLFDPSKIFYNRLLDRRIRNGQVLRDGDLTIFMSSPSSESDLENIWKQFTLSVKNC